METFKTFLLYDELMPFHFAVCLLFFVSIVETLGFCFGIRPLAFLKRFIPLSFNNPILYVKFSKILILIFFLINFSFAGYFIQFAFFAYQNSFAPIIYIILPTLLIALFFTIFMIHSLDQVIKPRFPQRKLNLLGRLATISSGHAHPNRTAQARIRDEYGQLHYVQVRSEFGEIKLNSQIILIRMEGQAYIAKEIVNSNHLFDDEIFPDDEQRKNI